MSESNRDREEKIAKIYHKLADLTNSNGVDVGPQGEEVLYDIDDRKDYFSLIELDPEEAALKRKLADATVILTSKDNVIEQEDGSFKLGVDEFTQGGLLPCEDESFRSQHVGGWCSGFMVGPDLIATAGHCGETESEIQNTAYVFGFKVASEDDQGTTHFSADQVYFGAELVAHDLSATGDYAIVCVDRAITSPGAAPLPVRKDGRIEVGENIGVIGYPSGLPVKIAFGYETVVIRDEDPWLLSNLDTYGGNSGSAVFNKDGLVEGILVRGARDYITDDENSCFKSNVLANTEGGEAVTKAKVFADMIPSSEEEFSDL
ncbi:MAG: V8-like Glu-specific endopeptidase [Desulforhopalus sp.]|jgi:V8-like Glu-specific endopeptidase